MVDFLEKILSQDNRKTYNYPKIELASEILSSDAAKLSSIKTEILVAWVFLICSLHLRKGLNMISIRSAKKNAKMSAQKTSIS